MLNVAVNVISLSSKLSLNTLPFNAIILVLLEPQLIETPECPVKLFLRTTSPNTLSFEGFPPNTDELVKANLAVLTANSSKSVVPLTMNTNSFVLLTAPLFTLAVNVTWVSNPGLITLPLVSITLLFEELHTTEVPSIPSIGSSKLVVMLVETALLPNKSPITIIAKASSTD